MKPAFQFIKEYAISKKEIDEKLKLSEEIYKILLDHDKGIPLEFREEIFNRYNQLGNKSGGIGLDFFIIRTLAERYNAKFSIENRVKDDYTKGTKFILEFEK